MTYTEAIQILKAHNKWRRGGDGPASPVVIGQAIDTICRLELAAKAWDFEMNYELIGRIFALSQRIDDVPKYIDSNPSDGWDELKEVLGLN